MVGISIINLAFSWWRFGEEHLLFRRPTIFFANVWQMHLLQATKKYKKNRRDGSAPSTIVSCLLATWKPWSKNGERFLFWVVSFLPRSERRRRQKKKKKETDRQRQRETEKDRETETERDREKKKRTDRQKQREIQTDKQKQRETETQTDKERQTDRETEKETERQTQRENCRKQTPVRTPHPPDTWPRCGPCRCLAWARCRRWACIPRSPPATAGTSSCPPSWPAPRAPNPPPSGRCACGTPPRHSRSPGARGWTPLCRSSPPSRSGWRCRPRPPLGHLGARIR